MYWEKNLNCKEGKQREKKQENYWQIEYRLRE